MNCLKCTKKNPPGTDPYCQDYKSYPMIAVCEFESPQTEQAEASSLSDLLWSDSAPKENGFYWCHQNKKTRMVKVWGNFPSRYTNEDGGAPVTDAIYEGAKWYGPIEPPPAP